MIRSFFSSAFIALICCSLALAVPAASHDSTSVAAKPASGPDSTKTALKPASQDSTKAVLKPAASQDSAKSAAKTANSLDTARKPAAKRSAAKSAAAAALDTFTIPFRPLPSFGAAKFDSALTDQARIYAGMLPLDSMRYARLTSIKGWTVHRKLFEENWMKLEKRLQIMTQWRNTELAGITQSGATLFYPFSGPDFLNGDLFFPECEKSIYISLEKTGEIPKADMSSDVFLNFIEDIRASLSNIFVRNYFVTSRMSEQFHTPYLKGNLAVFLVFLARRDCAIVSIKKIHLDSNGTLVAAPRDTGSAGKKQIGGMEINYVKSGTNGKTRSLYYFPVDIQDSSLKLKPQLQTYLKAQTGMIMFTKAASYCMHGNNFSMFRDLCLRSKAILEDDTGIPYRFFKPEEWSITLYGKYTKPVKDFNYGFQKDLDKAFSSGKNVKPLPFKIGYHWFDSYSSLFLAIRK
jgi:hypothetical protein